jgi:mRNA interferase RelE/StbE
MSFDVLIYPKIFDNIPSERRKQIIEAIKELKNPFPRGNKSKIEGYKEEIYRLRIGNYRAMYRIDFENLEEMGISNQTEAIIKGLELLTAEDKRRQREDSCLTGKSRELQAHKRL